MPFKQNTVNILVKIINDKSSNYDIKLAAITTLGDVKSASNDSEAIKTLLSFCESSNKEIAITAMQAIAKLSKTST